MKAEDLRTTTLLIPWCWIISNQVCKMLPPFHQQMVVFLQIMTPFARASITCG